MWDISEVTEIITKLYINTDLIIISFQILAQVHVPMHMCVHTHAHTHTGRNKSSGASHFWVGSSTDSSSIRHSPPLSLRLYNEKMAYLARWWWKLELGYKPPCVAWTHIFRLKSCLPVLVSNGEINVVAA